MASSAISLPISDAARELVISVRITGLKVFSARLWLAHQVLRLAALVAPVDMKIVVEFQERLD